MATTVIPINTSDSHGGDIPWQYVVGYITIGLIVWLITAILILRHDLTDSGEPIDNDEKILAVMMGLVTAAVWPLALVGFAIWKIVERAIRQPVNMTKRDR
ncbi:MULTISPECIES: hypothetical protein [unclassified Streptomyces]|uniref:hypothetical protein n=1 Tax=unclassified Streptomyces TaxID=2593676 RepID=UPI00136AF5E6|nr:MULTISPECIES: hypothetical protein [unclassified Streptomyces]NDZ98503.1 hypothetical protein [Streptomyces sp. SID10116]MYY79770.1 hypothetical protein [Streptomyces sp. SID335]MYZ16526.1 hypothetical protein [Streptomyces sp. SID337]NDZ84493.1 hypothetical protein [Streptomyces sp. SID10115]NEB43456.1 hypothetical protein [Streptomyces sp. SID339]